MKHSEAMKERIVSRKDRKAAKEERRLSGFVRGRSALHATAMFALSFLFALALTGPGQAQERWYKGDIHCHTDHSDGGLNQLADFLPRDVTVQTHIDSALNRGLDYLVISDHRTFSPYYDVLHDSDDLLLIPGAEWGGRPHGVIMGMNENILDPGFPDLRNTQSATHWAHAQGALMTMSHPADDNGWWTQSSGDYELTKYVDLIEVWNAGPYWFGAEANRESIVFWERFLNEGQRMVAVGASDTHFQQLDFAAGLGRPTTKVFARDHTEAAILDGIRAGHVYLTADPAFPTMSFEADPQRDGDYDVMMGDIVTYVHPKGARIKVEVQGASGAIMRVYTNTGALLSQPIDGDDFAYTFEVPATKAWYRVEIGRTITMSANALPSAYQTVLMQGQMLGCTEGSPLGGGRFRMFNDEPQVFEDLLALTNPIFIEPDPTVATPTPLPVDTSQNAPAILLAGYMDTTLSGGTPTLVALVDEAALGASPIELELYDGIRSTGLMLRDDGFSGDFNGNDGVYGVVLGRPPVPGQALLSIRATVPGRRFPSSWPFLVVR